MGDMIWLDLQVHGGAEFEVDLAEFEAAKVSGRLDVFLGCMFSQIAADCSIVEPSGEETFLEGFYIE